MIASMVTRKMILCLLLCWERKVHGICHAVIMCDIFGIVCVCIKVQKLIIINSCCFFQAIDKENMNAWVLLVPWWRHKMETFPVLLATCVGNSPVTGEFPTQRPVTPSLDVFFDLCLNIRFSKQSWGCWFEMPTHSYDVTVMLMG